MGSVLGDVRRRNPLPAYFLRRRVQRNTGQSGRPLVPRPQAALPGAVQHRRLSGVGLWGVVRGEHLIWFPAFFRTGFVGRKLAKKFTISFTVLRVLRRGSANETGVVQGRQGRPQHQVRAWQETAQRAALQDGHRLPQGEARTGWRTQRRLELIFTSM